MNNQEIVSYPPKKSLNGFMWYDWAMIVSLVLFSVFQLISATISIVEYCKSLYSFDFSAFYSLMSTYFFPFVFSLILPIIIIIFILRKSVFSKDAVFLFLLFNIINGARVLPLYVSFIVAEKWWKYVFYILAELIFLFMLTVPFLGKKNKPVIFKWIICGSFMAFTVFKQIAETLLVHGNAFSFFTSFIFDIAYFTAAFFLLSNSSEPVIIKKSKPFGVKFGSFLYTLIPCAISFFIGIVYSIIIFAADNNNAAMIVQGVLLLLFNAYAIIFFIIKLIQHFSVSKKSLQTASDNNTIPKKFSGNFIGESYSGSQCTSLPPDFYMSLALHIVLLLFTFGIYLLVWVYKTTERLNSVPGSEQRVPVNKLLLVMFVPFYYIYWFYKTAKIVDDFGIQCNDNSQISLAVLLLTIFLSPALIPPILVQNKMNNLFIANNGQPGISRI